MVKHCGSFELCRYCSFGVIGLFQPKFSIRIGKGRYKIILTKQFYKEFAWADCITYVNYKKYTLVEDLVIIPSQVFEFHIGLGWSAINADMRSISL